MNEGENSEWSEVFFSGGTYPFRGFFLSLWDSLNVQGKRDLLIELFIFS